MISGNFRLNQSSERGIHGSTQNAGSCIYDGNDLVISHPGRSDNAQDTDQFTFNLIRGSDPQPGANSTLDGQTVSFYDASFTDGETSQRAGAVVSIGQTIDIAVSGGTINIGRLRGAEGKVSGADFATATGLREGACFGG